MFGKIKKIFAKFLWRYPRVKMVLAMVSMIMCVLSFMMFLLAHGILPPNEAGRFLVGIAKLSGQTILLAAGVTFFVVFLLLPASIYWVFELPEYVVLEVQKLLQKTPNISRLNSLIEQVEQTGEVKELKKWMEDFDDYDCCLKCLPELQEQLRSLPQRIAETESEIKELKQRLGI